MFLPSFPYCVLAIYGKQNPSEDESIFYALNTINQIDKSVKEASTVILMKTLD